MRSCDGIIYFFLAYVYKMNTIVLCSMKPREDGSMVTLFTSIYSKSEVIVHTPKIHVIDKECLSAVQNVLKSKNRSSILDKLSV